MMHGCSDAGMQDAGIAIPADLQEIHNCVFGLAKEDTAVNYTQNA
jgi:hypothetical protein